MVVEGNEQINAGGVPKGRIGAVIPLDGISDFYAVSLVGDLSLMSKDEFLGIVGSFRSTK